jgi:hypothetical protein
MPNTSIHPQKSRKSKVLMRWLKDGIGIRFINISLIKFGAMKCRRVIMAGGGGILGFRDLGMLGCWEKAENPGEW